MRFDAREEHDAGEPDVSPDQTGDSSDPRDGGSACPNCGCRLTSAPLSQVTHPSRGGMSAKAKRRFFRLSTGYWGCFWLVAVMRLIGHLLRLYVGQGKTALVPTIHHDFVRSPVHHGSLLDQAVLT